MSKRNRNRRYSQTTHLVTDRRDIAREQEILSRPTAAYSQDRVVQQLIARLGEKDCTNQEALNIALALQQLLRGDAALLNNMDDPAVAETVAKIQENRAKMDKAERAFEEDQTKFVTGVFDQADKIRPVGDKRDKVIAQGANMYQEAVQNQRAKRSVKLLKFKQRLANDPKILINVEGVRELRKVNDALQEVLLPEVIMVMGERFVLQPGNQMVPKIIADLYAQRLKSRQESHEREQAMLLEKYVDYATLEKKNREIDERYGTRRERISQI